MERDCPLIRFWKREISQWTFEVEDIRQEFFSDMALVIQDF